MYYSHNILKQNRNDKTRQICNNYITVTAISVLGNSAGTGGLEA